MKTLICPHCDGTVSERARVCRGCGAEIIRGATRNEREVAGCVVTLLGMPVVLAVVGISGVLPHPRDDRALYYVLGLIVSAVVMYKIGTLLARWLRRSKLRFYRSYEHS